MNEFYLNHRYNNLDLHILIQKALEKQEKTFFTVQKI